MRSCLLQIGTLAGLITNPGFVITNHLLSKCPNFQAVNASNNFIDGNDWELKTTLLRSFSPEGKCLAMRQIRCSSV